MSKQNEKEREDIFLSQWISGQITDEELKAKVGETDFQTYVKIKHSLAGLGVADPDMAAGYASIQDRIALKSQRKDNLSGSLYKYLAIAALLLLFVGLYQFFVFSNEVETQFGEQQQLIMADQSVVSLNAQSSVTYPGFFQFNRKIRLKGEAFFEVQKGSKFTVLTSQGCVEVLGTKFTVNARPNFFEVKCYEGKVKVTKANQSQILTKGIAARFMGDKLKNWTVETERKPQWRDESSFEQLSFKHVIEAFQWQYDCEVTFPANLADTEITGSFTNKNLEVALQSICNPLQLKYKIESARKVTIYE